MTDHLKDPQAVSWGDLAEDFAFTDAEKDQIQKGAQAMVLASRVHRLAELRKRQHTTQVRGTRGPHPARFPTRRGIPWWNERET